MKSKKKATSRPYAQVGLGNTSKAAITQSAIPKFVNAGETLSHLKTIRLNDWLPKRVLWDKMLYPVRSRYPYTGYAELILRHGIPFDLHPLPDMIELGRPKKCLENAYSCAIRSDGTASPYSYVEGYALAEHVNGERHPYEHAWVIDRDGRAYDPTPLPSKIKIIELMGIPVQASYVKKIFERKNGYGVFNEFDLCPFQRGELDVESVIVRVLQLEKRT